MQFPILVLLFISFTAGCTFGMDKGSSDKRTIQRSISEHIIRKQKKGEEVRLSSSFIRFAIEQEEIRPIDPFGRCEVDFLDNRYRVDRSGHLVEYALAQKLVSPK